MNERDRYPEKLTINGVNPVLHVMIEGIIENQLHNQVGVLEVFSKLQKEDNLTPHAAEPVLPMYCIRGKDYKVTIELKQKEEALVQMGF